MLKIAMIDPILTVYCHRRETGSKAVTIMMRFLVTNQPYLTTAETQKTSHSVTLVFFFFY